MTERISMLWQRVRAAIPYAWLLIFFLAPFAIVFKISFSDPIISQPPFTPTFDESGDLLATFDNYRFLFSDKLYALSYLKSVATAAIAYGSLPPARVPDG
ncbi:MAG: hypothetical protein U5K76_12100 [Woeseiaceae bacterium]|nr:hypothetical protein [Woeseiaceae bacterium]